MTTAADLICRGYFPRELPPAFTTQQLGAFFGAAGASLPKIGRSLKDTTQCVDHNLARAGGLRRRLRIPNPVSYLELCRALEKIWPDLAAHYKTCRFSASKPRVTSVLERAVVPRLAQTQLPKLRARRWRGTRYFLRTDINQFYPSIYTHSIPWALHGKALSKANVGKTAGDALDTALRHQQFGQTVGVPIGPDASFAVAELLLTATDAALERECGILKGFRYVDDYELSFRTLAEAENALVTLQGLLAEYELLLNPRKTAISDVPIPLQEAWVGELQRFQFRPAGAGQLNDTIGFFAKAFELASHQREQAVLKYALMRVRELRFPAVGWRTFEGLLLSAASFDPSTLPVVLGLLSAHAAAGPDVSKLALADVLESIIERHAPLAHGSEVAWCLWGAIQFSIVLTAEAASRVSKMTDDIVALLAMDADSRNLFPVGALDRSQWSAQATDPNALRTDHWLMAYEAELKGWLSTPSLHKDPWFSALHKSGTSFYDASASPIGLTVAALAAPGGTLPGGYI